MESSVRKGQFRRVNVADWRTIYVFMYIFAAMLEIPRSRNPRKILEELDLYHGQFESIFVSLFYLLYYIILLHLYSNTSKLVAIRVLSIENLNRFPISDTLLYF